MSFFTVIFDESNESFMSNSIHLFKTEKKSLSDPKTLTRLYLQIMASKNLEHLLLS